MHAFKKCILQNRLNKNLTKSPKHYVQTHHGNPSTAIHNFLRLKKYLTHHKNIPQNHLYISGGINKPKQPKSVIGLFRRESSGSRGGVGGSILTVDGTDGTSARGSDPALAVALSQMVVVPSMPYNPRLDKRSQSISSGSGSAGIGDSGHAGPFPVTASHRRNVRRGSMLELSG